MALVVPNEGESWFLKLALKDAAPGTTTIRLFKNSVTLSDSTVWADLTEATFTGYASQSLSRAGWNEPTVGSVTYINRSAVTFSCSGGSQDVYGYAVTYTDGGTTYILWAESFSSPITISSGGSIQITPKIEAA